MVCAANLRGPRLPDPRVPRLRRGPVPAVNTTDGLRHRIYRGPSATSQPSPTGLPASPHDQLQIELLMPANGPTMATGRCPIHCLRSRKPRHIYGARPASPMTRGRAEAPLRESYSSTDGRRASRNRSCTTTRYGHERLLLQRRRLQRERRRGGPRIPRRGQGGVEFLKSEGRPSSTIDENPTRPRCQGSQKDKAPCVPPTPRFKTTTLLPNSRPAPRPPRR